MTDTPCTDARVDTENGFVERVICPSCKTDMDSVGWTSINCEGDNCWQTVKFRCPKCGEDKNMHSVYIWAGFEEVQ